MRVVGNKKPTCIIFLLTILVGIFISSCSFSTTETSIYNTFEEIDTLIELQEYKSAWKLVKKTSKKITNPVETLGIIKRSFILQENDFAKEYIEESLENFPDNKELLAIHSFILMEEKEYNKALPYAKKLEGSNYGSIYSELRFILDEIEVNTYNSEKEEEEKQAYLDYYSTYYAQAYADIYNSTGNSDYLKNVALVYALNGQLHEAFEYHPNKLSIYEDPYFWALISYDSHNFEQAIVDLQQESLTQEEIELLADSYARSDRIEDAYSIWKHSKSVFTTQSPISYHNAAVYNYNIDNKKVANETVLDLVKKFPTYIDGLSLFSEFSFMQETPKIDQGPFTSQLENKGLMSLEMEKNAQIPELHTSVAYSQITSALSNKEVLEETDYAKLQIEELTTKWKIANPQLTNKQKVADIWILLEKNQKEDYSYNPLLTQFAVWFFFTQEMYTEADALFTSHCTSYYSHYFLHQTEYNKTPIPEMTNWEYEFGGYIALIQERYEDALSWLQALIPNNTLTSTTSFSASLNLAQLLDMFGLRQNAISIYEQILNYEKDTKNRSEVYYRAAVILYEIGETKKAIFSLDESLKEYPGNSASQLLLKKIKN